MKSKKIIRTTIAVSFYLLSAFTTWGSDHMDFPLHMGDERNDANITDLYVFTRGTNLLLILCIDPTVPIGAKTYKFPTDVEYAFYIDNDAQINYDGTISHKNEMKENMVIKVRFGGDGKPEINSDIKESITNFFTGPRDDPFILGKRIRKNIAAIALELPIDAVVDKNSTLLIWATTKIDGIAKEYQERFGSPLRSQVNTALNTMHPKDDFKNFGTKPDVTVINTVLPSKFPNGRALEDDVVDIVCPGLCDDVLANDEPFPSKNDVLFLSEFPYLAPPH
jgi:hypothetical protein